MKNEPMYLRKLTTLFGIMVLLSSCKDTPKKKSVTEEEKGEELSYYQEQYRPQFHFSPEAKWMNDPNGMIYKDGVYHLFYQYYPEDTVWGPMHWGHATSTDLVHWEHKPVALFPDEHGLIFSGSAVFDSENTSGLGTDENPPMVAVFTYHNMKGEQEGALDFQTQGIAYSVDNGETWKKYNGNPVIGNKGIKDFRDPKVFWDSLTKRWIMSLVAGDHLQLWGSNDLKDWKKLSEFGKDQGAHGGVWECPDLFKLPEEGGTEEKWVLLISVNPGAPNGGSGTQYFIGDFDGERFTSDQKEIKWLDWGTDNYAGVTYNNAPDDEKIFIGWMSNWAYARDTPTKKWRGAMTVPRKLSLIKTEDAYELLNYPIERMDGLIADASPKSLQIAADTFERMAFKELNTSDIKFKVKAANFAVLLKNKKNEEVVLTMNIDKGVVFLDRIVSGKTDFKEGFGSTIQQMPIPHLPQEEFEVRILVDRSSMEIFINKGQYVMTAQLFPNEPYEILEIENASMRALDIKELTIGAVESVW